MALQLPSLDDRRYQDLLDEALARIPVHNPEWTNFNRSDPGITLIEIFAFLTENLLYRSNQIPERNRRKFLQLLGLNLQPATSSRGIVTLANERGVLSTITLNNDLEVRAGAVPFRTVRGLDVLPVEAKAFYKRAIPNPETQTLDYYKQLYASFLRLGDTTPATPLLYESVPFVPGADGLDLGNDTIDRSLWVALLRPEAASSSAVREALAGKTLSLGIVPSLTDATRQLPPGGQANPGGIRLLQYKIPQAGNGILPNDPKQRLPRYRDLPAIASTDVLAEPGMVDITLPGADELILWENLDPLEDGVGDFPPALEDSKLNDRVVTWLRITSLAAVRARLLWVGINAVFVTQRAQISNELLPNGTGEPDQAVVLSRRPVLPGSVLLRVTANNQTETWTTIDDLTSAGPEVPVSDPRLPPGAWRPPLAPSKVFALNAEAGEIRFGDGEHGFRPPLGARIYADYAYGVGQAGNVGAGSINSSPALPAGLKVTNPIPTWGGADAETVQQGEKQIARYLQHRDRLVNTADFETITRRTPGVDIGRVEVLPAFHPELSPNEPGDAPGAVTLMLIPAYDPVQPNAPMPDRLFLDAVCDYLDPRRLVTTEVFLRGPLYKSIWVSVGLDVVAGVSAAQVREEVKRALQRFLSPLPPVPGELPPPASFVGSPQLPGASRGWPLRKPVIALELLAVASRVPGVVLVNEVLLAEGIKDAADQIKMSGLELPHVLGISVVVGDPLGLSELRGQVSPDATPTNLVPLPVIAEECR